MKVSEAKTKVCPFMEVFIDINSVAFETMDNKNSYCICGDCMAWEYTKEYETQQDYGINQDLVAYKDWEKKMLFDGWVFNNHFDQMWEKPLPEEKKEGFCKRLGQ